MRSVIAPIGSAWFFELPPPNPFIRVVESVTDLSAIVQAMNEHVETHTSRSFQALVFTTAGDFGHVTLAPGPSSQGDHPDVSILFPNGAFIARITNLPGTDLKLAYDWGIIVSNHICKPPRNIAVQALFHQEWHGNIVVMKYGTGHRYKMNNVPSSEKYIVKAIVERWLQRFSTIEESLKQFNDDLLR